MGQWYSAHPTAATGGETNSTNPAEAVEAAVDTPAHSGASGSASSGAGPSDCESKEESYVHVDGDDDQRTSRAASAAGPAVDLESTVMSAEQPPISVSALAIPGSPMSPLMPSPQEEDSSLDSSVVGASSSSRSALHVALEFASPLASGASSSSLKRYGSSASTFAKMHSSTAASTRVHPATISLPVRRLARASSAPMNKDALASVSDAIQSGLRGSQTPHTPGLLTRDAKEQKQLLLASLFQAVDRDGNGYLEREELLAWMQHEPWLLADSHARACLLETVSHDEDSQCSRNEFFAAFESFTAAGVVTLIVNLLRAGMVSKIPKMCYTYNARDPYLNGLFPGVIPTAGTATTDDSPDSHSDTPARSLLGGIGGIGDAEKHFFLIDVLFQAMDRDLDGELDVKDLTRWLRADPWIHECEHEELFEAVDACWQEITERNVAAGFEMPSEDDTDGSAAASSTSPADIGPARLDKHYFFLSFSQVPKKQIRTLLVHLLSRNASSVMEDAETARRETAKGRNESSATPAADGTDDNTRAEVALVTLQTPAGTAALPDYPYPLLRRDSVVTGGARRLSGTNGLRVTLVGQSMVQHDLRTSVLGAQTLKELAPLLQADVIFTELETSLVRPGRTPEKTRNTVFFHAAGPEVVDCLVEAGFNMVATANNHAGDLGDEGIRTIMEEFASRNLCMAGIGVDARAAARPAFLDTPNGRIAQVAFASKIPENSIARADRAGVNNLGMIDVDAKKLDPVELTRVLTSIEEARDGFTDPVTNAHVPKADLIIAYHHNHYWEKNAAVNQEGAFGQWKRELAHRIIDAGAHVYVAHGDPRLQGIEIYRGSPIFYCTGNFIFQTKTAISFYGPEVWQSVIVHLHCTDVDEATSYSVKLVPIVLNEVGETEANHLETRGLPGLASRAIGVEILAKLQKLSASFGTTIRVEDSIEGDNTSPVIGWVLGPDATRTPRAVARARLDQTSDAAATSSPDSLVTPETSPPAAVFLDI